MSTLTAGNSLDLSRAQSRLRSYTGSALTRLRIQAGLDAFAFALTISAWTLVLLLFADKLFGLKNLGINVWIVWAGFSILGVPFVLWRMFSPNLHERRAAILADDRLGLHARLSSALTLDFADPNNAHFSEAFLSEAMRKMSAIRVQHAFPIRAPRLLAWLAVPAIAAAGIYYLMPKQDVLGITARAEARRRAEERKAAAADNLQGKLEDLKKDMEEKSADKNGGEFKVNQHIKDAQNIAKELKDRKIDSNEALLALGAVKQQMEKEKDDLQRGKEFADRLAKLQAKDLNLDEADHTKSISEALKAGDAGLAAKDMRKLAQQMKDLLNDPNKTPEEKKKEMEKLKNELEKLAGALAEDEALRDKLKEMSQTSMSAADYQKLQEEMNKAERKQTPKKFGDDIERQAEQVADELERLEEEQDTKLNEEEKEETNELEKIEEGVDEAMENLSGDGDQKGEQQGKEAGGKQGQGKPGSDKSGKGAQGKAGNGKMKSMSGKSGRQQGKGPGESGKNGSQPGGDKGNGDKGDNQSGRPGDGLGSGLGRGHRPYQDGDTIFTPEKAKGELRQGAITGISHFRGQGAKGDAPQEFYQTFEPANKEGASSLELERFPAEAREMVKDYFTRVRNDASNPSASPTPGPVPAPAPAPEPKKPEGPAKEGLKE